MTSTIKPQVKHTYGSSYAKFHRTPPKESNSTKSAMDEHSYPLIQKRKRSLFEPLSTNIARPSKRVAVSKANTKKPLTQLHFSMDTSILRTCKFCGLTYTKGAVDDEILHKAHCIRAQKGLDWGKEEEREKIKIGVVEIEHDPRSICKENGRIISVPLNANGKIGQKVSKLLETINLSLSAPSLTAQVMASAKAYLYLIPIAQGKERIIGCVVAQRIVSAMEVAKDERSLIGGRENLVHVDGGLYCNPEHLPTPLGIPRLFVSSLHRRKGIAETLLSACARTFIHGLQLDPERGEIAFSQPTSLGRLVMEKWGKGKIRIFEE